MKRRRPDLITLLAVLVGLGVVLTGLSQGVMRESQAQAAKEIVQQDFGRR